MILVEVLLKSRNALVRLDPEVIETVARQRFGVDIELRFTPATEEQVAGFLPPEQFHLYSEEGGTRKRHGDLEVYITEAAPIEGIPKLTDEHGNPVHHAM